MVLHVTGALHFVRGERAALELVEQRPMRLAHHLGQHVEATAVGHADHDFLHAEIAAALDDLLERRDQRLTAVETEPLGAGVLDVDELLEALGLDQLLQDGALALLGEGDGLVRTLDALLDPALLGRIGNVHELDAQRRAIGAAQDVDHLAHGRELETQHLVDEDLAIEILLGEAVGRGMQLLVVLVGRDLQRIELGVQMAAHAIGANHHDRTHRIARRVLQLLLGEIDALGRRLALELVLEARLEPGPVAVERGHHFARRRHRPVRALPRRTLGALQNAGAVLAQFAEELAPARVDRGRILFVTGVHFLDPGGIAAVEEGSQLLLFTIHCASRNLAAPPRSRWVSSLDGHDPSSVRSTCPSRSNRLAGGSARFGFSCRFPRDARRPCPSSFDETPQRTGLIACVAREGRGEP